MGQKCILRLLFTRWLGLFLFLICALLFASCVPLPEYARPQFYKHLGTVEDADSSGFRYRALAIGDFKAKTLPADFQQYHESINARSCLTIRPSSLTSAQISEVSYYGNLLYVGHFNAISFEALFIPSCSWWSDAVAESKIDYVLQHEQIHFAIAEVSARRATREIKEKMKDYSAVGGTRAEVAEELNRALMDAVHELLASDLEIHTQFDEDTSMFFDQDRQNGWYNKLLQQLDTIPQQP